MTRRLLTFSVLAAIAVSGASITVFACGDKTEASNASASNASAESVPDCCKAKGAKSAKAAKHSKGTPAVTASAADHCAQDAAVTTAAFACTRDKAAQATTAAASNGASTHKNSAGYDAAVAGSASCGSKGVSTMAGTAGHDCDACADMAMCEDKLKTMNSNFQVVPLKNGVMYVYTADKGKDVRAVQAAIARRTDRLNALLSAEKVKLCPDCKAMRGAMASGKLNREVVNIELGSISLVTSNDPAMVGKLYAMAGLGAAGSQKLVKS